MQVQKGFVFTLSAVLVLAFLVLFSQLLVTQAQAQNESVSERILLSKASFAIDDLQADFQKILTTKFNAKALENSAVLSFSDFLSNSKLLSLSSFKSFAENDFALKTNAVVSVNTQGFENGTAVLECSNGLQVEQEHGLQDFFFFYSIFEGTNAAAFDVNLVYFGDLNSFTAWQWNPQGDLQVSFYYKDSSQTLKTSGKISSEVLNNYLIEFKDGSKLVVSAGKIQGKSKALKISSNASNAIDFNVSMQVPLESKPVSCEYPASVSYSQLNALIERNFKPARIET